MKYGSIAHVVIQTVQCEGMDFEVRVRKPEFTVKGLVGFQELKAWDVPGFCGVSQAGIPYAALEAVNDEMQPMGVPLTGSVGTHDRNSRA